MDIDRSTAWRLEQDGILPKPIYIGRRAYYPAEALEEFEARARRGEYASSGSNRSVRQG
jgi:predicted DNA-binding transcriptional regulator AlpA